MPALAVRRFGMPPGRAIGTGCALDSARFRDRLSREFGIAPQSMHTPLQGYKTLNRIQSRIFTTAYTSNENILVCAPTGE
jgi:malate/lactate dehydrogenase